MAEDETGTLTLTANELHVLYYVLHEAVVKDEITATVIGTEDGTVKPGILRKIGAEMEKIRTARRVKK